MKRKDGKRNLPGQGRKKSIETVFKRTIQKYTDNFEAITDELLAKALPQSITFKCKFCKKINTIDKIQVCLDFLRLNTENPNISVIEDDLETMLEELIDIMNDEAPKGCWFGGRKISADIVEYGFWDDWEEYSQACLIAYNGVR